TGSARHADDAARLRQRTQLKRSGEMRIDRVLSVSWVPAGACVTERKFVGFGANSFWCGILVACVFLASVAAAMAADKALVGKGEYLARAGDCIACHTDPGGALFAGGRPMATPFGTIYTSNITPDPSTG